MYELAGDAKPVLERIENVRKRVRECNEKGILFYYNVKGDLEELEHYIRIFLEKHRDFPYKERVQQILESIRDEIRNNDPTFRSARVVRRATLPEGTHVYLNLNELADIIREGYHSRRHEKERILFILIFLSLTIFLFLSLKTTSKVISASFIKISFPIIMSVVLLILLIFFKVKKH